MGSATPSPMIRSPTCRISVAERHAGQAERCAGHRILRAQTAGRLMASLATPRAVPCVSDHETLRGCMRHGHEAAGLHRSRGFDKIPVCRFDHCAVASRSRVKLQLGRPRGWSGRVGYGFWTSLWPIARLLGLCRMSRLAPARAVRLYACKHRQSRYRATNKALRNISWFRLSVYRAADIGHSIVCYQTPGRLHT